MQFDWPWPRAPERILMTPETYALQLSRRCEHTCKSMWRYDSAAGLANTRLATRFRFLSPVHTSNNVEATFDLVETTFDFVAKNGNNIERVFREISPFRNKLNEHVQFV